jgi:hypothetical protein
VSHAHSIGSYLLLLFKVRAQLSFTLFASLGENKGPALGSPKPEEKTLEQEEQGLGGKRKSGHS